MTAETNKVHLTIYSCFIPLRKKEKNDLFNDALFTVKWRQTYGRGPLK